MTFKPIYLIVGDSGAGKDYLAARLQELDPALAICKFATPGKRLFEQIYCLPVGTLSDREQRLAFCPGTTDTYLDRFIYWFHHQDEIFPPRYFLKQAFGEIVGTLAEGQCSGVITTDSRSPSEIDMLIRLAHTGVPIQPVLIRRAGAQPRSSDIHLRPNLAKLDQAAGRCGFIARRITIDNDGDIRHKAAEVIDLAKAALYNARHDCASGFTYSH